MGPHENTASRNCGHGRRKLLPKAQKVFSIKIIQENSPNLEKEMTIQVLLYLTKLS